MHCLKDVTFEQSSGLHPAGKVSCLARLIVVAEVSFSLGWNCSCCIFSTGLHPKLTWKLKLVKNAAVLLRSKSWTEHEALKIWDSYQLLPEMEVCGFDLS